LSSLFAGAHGAQSLSLRHACEPDLAIFMSPSA
jgi:hypothetical protein